MPPYSSNRFDDTNLFNQLVVWLVQCLSIACMFTWRVNWGTITLNQQMGSVTLQWMSFLMYRLLSSSSSSEFDLILTLSSHSYRIKLSIINLCEDNLDSRHCLSECNLMNGCNCLNKSNFAFLLWSRDDWWITSIQRDWPSIFSTMLLTYLQSDPALIQVRKTLLQAHKYN